MDNAKFVDIRSVSAFTTLSNSENGMLRAVVIALEAYDSSGSRLFVRLAPDSAKELRDIIGRALNGQ